MDKIKPWSSVSICAHSAGKWRLYLQACFFKKINQPPEKIDGTTVTSKLIFIPCMAYLTEKESRRALPNKLRVIAFPSRALSSSLYLSLSIYIHFSSSIPFFLSTESYVTCVWMHVAISDVYNYNRRYTCIREYNGWDRRRC